MTLKLFANVPLPQEHAVGIAGLVLLDHLVPTHWPARLRDQRFTGLVIVAIGIALNVWAVEERQRMSTGAFRLEEPEDLVTSGPYALTRHPMYVGWSLVHLGVGLLRRSCWVCVTLPAALAAEHHLVTREDEDLAREFGETFERYQRQRPTVVERLQRCLRSGHEA